MNPRFSSTIILYNIELNCGFKNGQHLLYRKDAIPSIGPSTTDVNAPTCEQFPKRMDDIIRGGSNMTHWIRNRLALLLAAFMVFAVISGCSSKETAKPSVTTAAPAASAPAPAPAPQVDKATVLKDAAVSYFNNLPPTSNMMDAAEVKKKIEAKDPGIYLLDIRAAADFDKLNVKGFNNMPFATIGANISKLPKDKQIIVTCYSGQTAGQTVGVLKMAGFNAVSVKGGFSSLDKAFGLTPAQTK